MVIYLKRIVAAVFVVTLAACANIQADIPKFDKLLKAQTEQDGRACIHATDIRGYGVLDDNVVSIDGRRANEYYLLTTIYQCQSLMTGSSAAFVSGFSQLCGGGRDKIVTDQDSCPIHSIFKFESREQAFAAFDEAQETRKRIREEFNKQKTQ